MQSPAVKVQISGASAIVDFTSASLTGSLSPSAGVFGQGGTVFTFTVGGVSYSGSPTTTTATSGLITSVEVSAAGTGATVTIKLSSPASRSQFAIGHTQVGVALF